MSPVQNRRLVVDFLAESRYNGARRPDQFFLVPALSAGDLLREQRVEDGDDPVFEEAVVCVWDDKVADAVHALFPEVGTVGGEAAEVGGAEAFDDIFFDAARCGDDGGDVVVLDEVAEGGAEAGGYEV